MAANNRLRKVCRPPLSTLARPITPARKSPNPSHRRLNALASAPLIVTPAWSFSQIRGTAKNRVGWTSRRFSWTVSMDSAKLRVRPMWAAWNVEKMRSATWHSGR